MKPVTTRLLPAGAGIVLMLSALPAAQSPHYRDEGSQQVAREIDRIGDEGLKTYSDASGEKVGHFFKRKPS